MRYHSESGKDYYLPYFLEGKIRGLEFSDVIGGDHLERLVEAGIERPLYCFDRYLDNTKG